MTTVPFFLIKFASILLASFFLTQPTAEEFFKAGMERSEAKNFEGADEAFTLAIEQNPNMQLAYFHRAIVRFNIADFSGAAADLNASVRLNRNHAPSYLYRALVRNNIGANPTVVALDFDKAIELDPNYKEALYERGLYYMNDKKFLKAKGDFTRLTKLDTANEDYLMKLAECKYETIDTAGAIEDYRKVIRINPKNYLAYYILSEILLNQSKDEAAAEILERCLEVNPEFAEGCLRLAHLYSKGFYHWDEQENYKYEVIVKALQSIANDRQGLVAYDIDLFFNINRGIGSWEKSEVLYKKAISLNPKCAKAYNMLGNFYCRSIRYTEAIENYKKALELDSVNCIFLANLAYTYMVDGDKDLAYTELLKSVAIDSNYYRNYLLYSDYYWYFKKYDSCLIYHDRLLEKNSKNPYLFFELATIKLKLKDTVGFCNAVFQGNALIPDLRRRKLPDICKKQAEEAMMKK